MEYLIREAEIKDYKVVKGLISDLAELHGESSKLSKKSLDEYLQNKSTSMIVADEGGVVVGLLSFHVFPELSSAKSMSIIDGLIVKKKHRNKGIGASLVNYALKKMKQSNCDESSIIVNMTNIYAQRFYKFLGFHYKPWVLLSKKINQ